MGSDVTDRVFLWMGWLRQQLFDGIKKHGNLAIMLLHFSREVFIRGEYLSDFDEGADDGDIHLNSTFAAKYTGKHGDAMFSEGVWEGATEEGVIVESGVRANIA